MQHCGYLPHLACYVQDGSRLLVTGSAEHAETQAPRRLLRRLTNLV